MKYDELQQRSLQDLENVLENLSIKLGKAHFELANNTLKDISIIKKTRKDIARVLTAVKKLKLSSPEEKSSK